MIEKAAGSEFEIAENELELVRYIWSEGEETEKFIRTLTSFAHILGN